jgi:hypothetical protein
MHHLVLVNDLFLDLHTQVREGRTPDGDNVAHAGSTIGVLDPEIGEVIVHQVVHGGEIAAGPDIPQPPNDGGIVLPAGHARHPVSRT